MKKTLKDANNPNFASTKIKKPYDSKGKTNFNLRKVPGVYFIYDNKKLVYIGWSSNNLYRTMYRHFSPYRDKQPQYRVYFDDLTGILARVIYCKTTAQAKRLEGALILKYKPKLNDNTYKGFVLDDKDEETLRQALVASMGVIETKGDLPF